MSILLAILGTDLLAKPAMDRRTQAATFAAQRNDRTVDEASADATGTRASQ
jgi:hypothetical protein